MAQKQLDKFETIFKTEPIFCDESPSFDEINLNLEIGNKCGDVFFRSDDSKFSLNCAVCSENFKEFTLFSNHYLHHHVEEKKDRLQIKSENENMFPALEEAHIPIVSIDENKSNAENSPAKNDVEVDVFQSLDSTIVTDADMFEYDNSNESETFQSQSCSEPSNENDSDYEELRCDRCNTKFDSSIELETHQEQKMCGKSNQTNDNKIRRRRKRNLENTYCKKCKTQFDLRAEYLKHLYKCKSITKSEECGEKRFFKKGEKKYSLEERTCKICGRECANMSALTLHSKWHLDFSERAHKCEVCSKGFNVKAHLEHHLKTIHGPKLYECDFCFIKFNSINLKNQHQRAHSKAFKKLSVEIGNKKEAVIKHIESGNLENLVLGENYNVPDGYWRCDICHKMLGNTYKREEHLKFHAEVKPFVCELCGKSMVSQQVLTYHMLVHNNDRRFPCSKCGSKFYIAAHLRRHLRTACNPDKKFQCNVCLKKFSRNEHLNNHLQTHNEVRTKDFNCEICGNEYSNANSLGVHKRKHSANNPYLLDCHLCHTKFSSKGSLQRHIKRHENKDAFACDQCDKKFNDKEDLKGHQKRQHSGEIRETYSCNVCGKPYKKKQDLNAHLKKHASNEPH